jgi:hypothetical protein
MKSLQQTLSDKPSVNFFSWIGMAAVLMLIAAAPAAVAQTYNFTFTGGGGMDATGTISIVGGVAQSGSINVTGVPLEAAPHTPLTTAAGDLVPDPASPTTLTLINHDGDNIIFDNIVSPGDPSIVQVLNGNGLGFASGQYQDSVHYNALINLWGNSPGSYTLFVAEAQLDGNGNVIGDPQWVYTTDTGSLTLITVPEPSTDALVILGALTLGSAVIRRRRVAA